MIDHNPLRHQSGAACDQHAVVLVCHWFDESAWHHMVNSVTAGIIPYVLRRLQVVARGHKLAPRLCSSAPAFSFGNPRSGSHSAMSAPPQPELPEGIVVVFAALPDADPREYVSRHSRAHLRWPRLTRR
jgi:hypothetical protein